MCAAYRPPSLKPITYSQNPISATSTASITTAQKLMCDFPYSVKNPKYGLHAKGEKLYIPVPCGKCPPCLQRRSNGWQFRLLQHEKVSERAYFITLTYAPEHCPITPKKRMTLDKRDWQLFMKRLRKAHGKHSTIRYYAVGEYGSRTYRPHYHAIMFDINPDLLEKAWHCPKTNTPMGIVHVGDVSGASVAYTCKYMHKGKVIPQYAGDDRLPEFSLMSKKLGANYMSDAIMRYHQNDITRNYVTMEGGVKVAMPRYYREKIFTPLQRTQQGKIYESISKATAESSEISFTHRTGDSSAGAYERSDFEAKAQKLGQFKQRAKDARNSI